MDKEIVIVLIDVNATGSCGESARTICERIEGRTIEDFDNEHDLADLAFSEDDHNSLANSSTYMVWPLTDFSDACNDGTINLNIYFMTWVYTTKN